MVLSFFDQFMSPVVYHIPLVLVAMSLPFILYPQPLGFWKNDRVTTLQAWFVASATSQLFSPISEKGHKWSVLFISLLLFILTMNVLGLLPYTFTPTTQLSLNLGLAVPLWLATVIVGLRNNPTHSFAHFLPEGTPNFLVPVLIIIETISLFIRPLALGVRLTANLTAGHLLIQLIATATMVLAPMYLSVGILVGGLLFLLSLLEVAVALIQAYVFVLLLCLYLQENV